MEKVQRGRVELREIYKFMYMIFEDFTTNLSKNYI